MSTTAHRNVRSQRVMQRTGMRRELEFDHPRESGDIPFRPHLLHRAA